MLDTVGLTQVVFFYCMHPMGLIINLPSGMLQLDLLYDSYRHRSLAKIFFINHDNMVVEGIAAVTAAALLFGVVAALVKYADVHSLILLQFRSAVQLALSLTAVKLCLPEKQWSQMFGPHELWPVLALRSLLYWGFLCLWWLALTCMPVGDATCVVYLGPIFTAGFSWLLLKEFPPRVFPLLATKAKWMSHPVPQSG